jgi:hypothetical protein
VLHALRHGVALGALVLGFLLAVGVAASARVVVARLTRQFAILPGGRRWDVRHQVDPFGVVGAVIAGVGWIRGLDIGGRWRLQRARRAALALAGPVANLVVGTGLVVGYQAAGGPDLSGLNLSDALQGALLGTAGQQLIFGAAAANLGMGLLAIVPIPPLAGGDVMFSLAPPTLGWQRLRYYLDDQHIGIVIVLVLLLLPLGGAAPPLLDLVNALARPLLQALNNLSI